MKNELGILCHISSLPSKYGIGDFGQSSRDFIDFLKEKGFTIWQILPLNKTNEYNCPYSSTCYFSFDEMFVDPEYFVENNLINPRDLKTLKTLSKSKKVKYQLVKAEKEKLINIAFNNLTKEDKLALTKHSKKIYGIFDYAYYSTVLKHFGTDNFRDINPPLWNKTTKEYKAFKKEHEEEILKQVYSQYLLNIQWQQMKKYANKNGIKILGDLPIYPNPNSFDVFERPDQFQLDKNLQPLVYGGVPGDDFCPDGQNWGTCVYNWKLMKKDNYNYLVNKIKLFVSRFDILRLDHVMGYDHHHEWIANSNEGRWVDGGGVKFFNTLSKQINMKQIVIEDLGIVHQSLIDIKEKYNLKGMSVAQFAIDNNETISPSPNNITYLGTHDNNTFLGYLKSLNSHKIAQFCNLIGIENKNLKQIQIDTIKKLINTPNATVILQMQDYLLQDEKQRMNYPGRAADCWEYKMPKNYKKIFNRYKFK